MNNNVLRGAKSVCFNSLIKISSVMSLICLFICPQMVANMASGLLAEPRPSRGAGVSDKTQRVRPFSAVEAHPKHCCEQSQRKTLTQALKQTEDGVRPGL